MTAALVKRLAAAATLPHVFLNLNLPDLPLDNLKGVKITQLASESHINSVEEKVDGTVKSYKLLRERAEGSPDRYTDIWAIDHGYASITPLYFSPAKKPSRSLMEGLCHGLIEEALSG